MIKGPTIAAIYGLKAIRDLELPIDRRIRVIFGCDEENGSSCVRHYVESGDRNANDRIYSGCRFPSDFL